MQTRIFQISHQSNNSNFPASLRMEIFNLLFHHDINLCIVSVIPIKNAALFLELCLELGLVDWPYGIRISSTVCQTMTWEYMIQFVIYWKLNL
jgi:hypothetical protein